MTFKIRNDNIIKYYLINEIRYCGLMVEHVTRNDGVVGSIPTSSSIELKSLELL